MQIFAFSRSWAGGFPSRWTIITGWLTSFIGVHIHFTVFARYLTYFSWNITYYILPSNTSFILCKTLFQFHRYKYLLDNICMLMLLSALLQLNTDHQYILCAALFQCHVSPLNVPDTDTDTDRADTDTDTDSKADS